MAVVLVADRDGRYVDASEDALTFLRVSREDLLARRIGFFDGPHAELAENVWHRVTSSGGDIPTGEATIYRPDGTHARVRYTRIAQREPGIYELELLPIGDGAGPPVADRPSDVLREWRSAERAIEAGERDGAVKGAEGLRELYQHSIDARSKQGQT